MAESAGAFQKRFDAEASVYELSCGETIPAIKRFTGIAIGRACSAWTKPRTKTRKIELTGETAQVSVAYRTEFNLYRSMKGFYLHKLGVSDNPSDDTFYAVIQFKDAQGFGDILKDTSDKRVRPSRPIIELIQQVSDSEWLTEAEQAEWSSLLVGEED